MATQMPTNSWPIPAVDWRVYILHTASMIGGGDSLPTKNSVRHELMQLPCGTDRRGLCTVDLAAGYLTRFLPIEFAQFRSQLYVYFGYIFKRSKRSTDLRRTAPVCLSLDPTSSDTRQYRTQTTINNKKRSCIVSIVSPVKYKS